MFAKSWLPFISAAVLAAVFGCEKSPPPASPPGSALPNAGTYGYGGAYGVDHKSIQFNDAAKTNTEVQADLSELQFTSIDGQPLNLKDYHGKQNVVLVITRGFTGSICLYCSTQTSRLIANYQQFADRNAEVVVAFPVGEKAQQQYLNDFVQSAREKLDTPVEKIPFPILLDLDLSVVNSLGIRADLSKPATYIIDKEGHVRFAYVGTGVADRPSVKSLLEQLDAISDEPPGPASDVPSAKPAEDAPGAKPAENSRST